MAYPQDPQTVFASRVSDLNVGDQFMGDVLNDRRIGGYVASITPQPLKIDATITPNNGDQIGWYIDGALVFVVSTADANATGLLLQTATAASPLLAALVGVTVAGAVASLTFADNDPHTVVAYSPATADIAFAQTQAPINYQRFWFGYAMVKDPIAAHSSANGIAIATATAVTQTVLGYTMRIPGAAIESTRSVLLEQGFDPDFLPPEGAYGLEVEGAGIVVEYAGAPPQPGDPVYVDMVGVGASRVHRITSGATPKSVTLTVVSVADGLVGFQYDALPALTLTATASAVNDAASLFALFTASAAYLALLPGAASIVDVGDGTITITFAEGVDPVFTDASTVSSSVAEAVDVAFVAATAKLLPNSSWVGPANTALTPPGAYLRVDVRGN